MRYALRNQNSNAENVSSINTSKTHAKLFDTYLILSTNGFCTFEFFSLMFIERISGIFPVLTPVNKGHQSESGQIQNSEFSRNLKVMNMNPTTELTRNT